MRKKLLLLCVAGLLAVNAFADHPSGLGLGIFGGGGGSATAAGSGNLGLSLKLPGLPIFWGVTANFGEKSTALSVSGDYYLLDEDLTRGSFDLDWYLGIGGFGHFYFGDDNFYAAVGARLPIGLSWHIVDKLELFGDIVPGIGIDFHDGLKLYWVWGAELGLRLWL